MVTVFVKVDHAGIAELEAPGGSVYKHVRNLGREIAVAAKIQAPKRTGRLAASIRSSVRMGARGPEAKVTANANYAYIVHNGQRPHMILPKRHEFLKFRSHGRIVYARAVRHPGARPRPFLYDAMREVVTRA